MAAAAAARLPCSRSRLRSHSHALVRNMATSSTSQSNLSRFTSRDSVSSRIKDEYNSGSDVWSMFNPVVFPKAINLGQGFMNWSPPRFALEAIQKATETPLANQYSHPKGRPRLRKAIADTYGSSFRKPAELETWAASSSQGVPAQRPDAGRELDIEKEVLVTAGANGGIYASLTAMLEPGDEVIVFDPHFDQYECEITFMGAVPVYVPFVPPSAEAGKKTAHGNVVDAAADWDIDWQVLESKLASGKVKALIHNTPHNPIGKVFSLPELQRLAALCIKYDVLVVADEVYDGLTFGEEHVRIASLEGMWDRTLTIGSAGKTFACTGWRIGWAIGPPHLIAPTLTAHTRIVFAVNSPASEAVAEALEAAPSQGFFAEQVGRYGALRTQLTSELDACGLRYTLPAGAYFVLVDVGALRIPPAFELPPEVRRRHSDFHAAWFLAQEAGLVVIPATAFYSAQNAGKGQRYLRFSFCKTAEEIREGMRRLRGIMHHFDLGKE